MFCIDKSKQLPCKISTFINQKISHLPIYDLITSPHNPCGKVQPSAATSANTSKRGLDDCPSLNMKHCDLCIGDL